MTASILERLVAVHRALDAAGFDHAVGGALSLAVHVANPRATADIDLNVSAEASQAEAVLACLPEQILVPGGAAAEIRRADQIRLVWPSPETPVDLFFIAHPAYHRMVNERAVEFDFGGDVIKVLQPVDLTVFKVLFGRSKDWVDIETLMRESLGDPGESRRWLVEILGEEAAGVARFDRLVQTAWGVEEPAEPSFREIASRKDLP